MPAEKAAWEFHSPECCTRGISSSSTLASTPPWIFKKRLYFYRLFLYSRSIYACSLCSAPRPQLMTSVPRREYYDTAPCRSAVRSADECAATKSGNWVYVAVVAHVYAAHAVTAWPTNIVMLGDLRHSVPESRTTMGRTFTLLDRLV
jgi:hypothetical protein